MNINLCFVTDDGYSMPTCVTITSILMNKNKTTNYNIYILCSNVNEKNKMKFMELNQEKFNIYLIDLENKFAADDYKIPGIPATPTSIYKFFIPDILKNIDKVIYLDGDIIVTSDLSELYTYELNDKILAAVKDTNGLNNKSSIYNKYKYFNSGLLLMNLKKMRSDNISSKLFDYRKNGFNKLMDQDTFNFVLKDKTLLLPFKYNVQMNTLSSEIMKYENYNMYNFKKYWVIDENCKNIFDIMKNATILHYTTAKPWKFYDGYGNDIWFKYYLCSPYKSEELFRESYYIRKIINSKSYKLTKKITKIGIFKKKKNKKYIQFLNNFIDKKR